MTGRENAGLIALVIALAASLLILVPALVVHEQGPARPAPATIPDPGVRPVLDLPTPAPTPRKAVTP